MKKELQDKLFKDFPKIFRQKNLSMKETCMCWGIDVDDGWEPLIRDLCECIQGYIDANPHLMKPHYKPTFKQRLKDAWNVLNGKSINTYPYEYPLTQLEAVQVKEKFGTLRYYAAGGCKTFDGMIWLAEHLSGKICEVCGERGGLKMNGGWYKTLCPKCTEKLKYKSIPTKKDKIKYEK